MTVYTISKSRIIFLSVSTSVFTTNTTRFFPCSPFSLTFIRIYALKLTLDLHTGCPLTTSSSDILLDLFCPCVPHLLNGEIIYETDDTMNIEHWAWVNMQYKFYYHRHLWNWQGKDTTNIHVVLLSETIYFLESFFAPCVAHPTSTSAATQPYSLFWVSHPTVLISRVSLHT